MKDKTIDPFKYETETALERYRREIGDIPLLTKEDMITLSKKIEASLKEILLIVTEIPASLDIIQAEFAKIRRGEAKLNTLLYGGALDKEQGIDDLDLPPNVNKIQKQLSELFVLKRSAEDCLSIFGPDDEKTCLSQYQLWNHLCSFHWSQDLIHRLFNFMSAFFQKKDIHLQSHKEKTLKRRLLNAMLEMKHAKEMMVESNLRLVFLVAKKYFHCGVSFLDLIQEGNLGLIQAVDRFQYRLGFTFATYATAWIRHTIQKSISKQRDIIQIPAHMQSVRRSLSIGTAQLLQTLDRKPTTKELGEWMEMPEAKVQALLDVISQPISLQTQTQDDEDYFLEDHLVDATVSPLEAVTAEDLSKITQKALFSLPPREAEILRMRFGIDRNSVHTLEEVGQHFNISRERVRQIEARALRALRRQSNIEQLKLLLR